MAAKRLDLGIKIVHGFFTEILFFGVNMLGVKLQNKYNEFLEQVL